MIYKLIEIVSSFPQKVIWLGNKLIIIEERFGKRKEIIKNYRITSVCMENGAQALKDVSDIVCPAVTEDGLAKAFEQLGLLGEN